MERTIPTYNRLFKKHYRAILNFCNKKLLDKDAGKDVAQNTFIKLWANIEKLESDINAKRFIFICARNECFNVLEVRNRQRKVDPEALTETLFENMTLDFDIIEADVMGYLYECLKDLPERNQATIRLYLKGYNSHQVAKQLGCTEKTALNQKLKAITILRNKLKLKFGI